MQTIPVQDFQSLGITADQTAVSQLLQRPIHVDRGHAGGIGEIGLCDMTLGWPTEFSEADDLQPNELFAKYVGQALRGAAATHIGEPSLQQRALSHAVPPNRAADVRVQRNQLMQNTPFDACNHTWGQRTYPMIVNLAPWDEKIGEVSRDQKAGDLALATNEHFVPARGPRSAPP